MLMANMITTLVRKYHYRGEDFVIVRESKDGVIRAINYKYLDERGVLKQKLNGLQMYCDHERNTVPEIIERINHDLDLNAYLDEHNIERECSEQLIRAIIAFNDQYDKQREGVRV
jgi:hypothetical protein